MKTFLIQILVAIAILAVAILLSVGALLLNVAFGTVAAILLGPASYALFDFINRKHINKKPINIGEVRDGDTVFIDMEKRTFMKRAR